MSSAAAKMKGTAAPPTKASPQQVSALLQDLIGKCGLTTQEALPVVKVLIQAGTYSLADVSKGSNLPDTVPSKVRKKILSAINKMTKTKQGGTSPSAAKKSPKRRKTNPIMIPAVTTRPDQIMINRSPVLTLWASIVAQELFDLSWEEGLSLGSAYAGMLARAKGTSLGIYSEQEQQLKFEEKDSSSPDSDIRTFALMDQSLRVKETPVGLRAILPNPKKHEDADYDDNEEDDIEQDPHKTWNHLQKKFGDALPHVIELMKQAADTAVALGGRPDSNHSDNDNKGYLAGTAYQYYMHIRPDIPHGTKGWGAHGHLFTNKLQDYYQSTPSK